MQAITSGTKSAFISVEKFVLKFRDTVSAVTQVLKGKSTQPEKEVLLESQNLEPSDLHNSLNEPRTFCHQYTLNYDGTTCVQQACSTPCVSCCSCTQFFLNLTKNLTNCTINLLCYPFFLSYAIPPLPSSCNINGYSEGNSTYTCYSETCGYCNQTDEKRSLCKFCCTQQCCLVWGSFLLAIACLTIWNLTQDTNIMIQILLYFENINEVTSVFLFVILFTLVSFPLLWGYVILNLAAGYLYGFMMAVPIVIGSVTVGVAIAHVICKRYFATCILGLLQKRSNFNQIEAILKVIHGASGLKIVALTRLTPIPFGFQNGLFAVSDISLKYYLLASNIGLLPTQILNCYIGSTFRSVEQIMEQNSPGGYLLFLLQIGIGIGLMIFVIRHARRELASALQSSSKNGDSNLLPLTEESINGSKKIESPEDVKCSQPVSSTTSSTHITLKLPPVQTV